MNEKFRNNELETGNKSLNLTRFRKTKAGSEVIRHTKRELAEWTQWKSIDLVAEEASDRMSTRNCRAQNRKCQIEFAISKWSSHMIFEGFVDTLCVMDGSWSASDVIIPNVSISSEYSARGNWTSEVQALNMPVHWTVFNDTSISVCKSTDSRSSVESIVHRQMMSRLLFKMNAQVLNCFCKFWFG